MASSSSTRKKMRLTSQTGRQDAPDASVPPARSSSLSSGNTQAANALSESISDQWKAFHEKREEQAFRKREAIERLVDEQTMEGLTFQHQATRRLPAVGVGGRVQDAGLEYRSAIHLEEQRPESLEPTPRLYQHIEGRPGTAHQQKRMEYLRLSNQIYVLGSDLQGRFLAHKLAECDMIPRIRYLINDLALWKIWSKGGEGIRFSQGRDKPVAHSLIDAEYVSHPWEYRPPLSGRPSREHIEHLIVTLPCHQTLQALKPLRGRLDHRTTICLMQDGLGLAERLTAELFRDPLTRPMFLLGQATHALGYAAKDRLAVSQVRGGRLHLSIYRPTTETYGKHISISLHPPIEHSKRHTRLLRLLAALPGLDAKGSSLDFFYRHKLPTTAFRAVADPITAVMNCTYDKIMESTYSRQLFAGGLSEICAVIMRFPEAKQSESFARWVRSGMLQSSALHKLVRKRSASNTTRWAARWGEQSDIDFLTGYFIQRGRHLNVPTPTLEILMLMFKASQAVRSDEFKAEIPFEGDGVHMVE